MNLTKLLLFLTFVYCVRCKINQKSLTEAMGQEIIEIGAPSKDLPPGVEEEPSAEADEDVKTTATSIQPATKRESKKATIKTTKLASEKINALSQEEDEMKIEREFAEIYKDTDYKESSESVPPEETSVKVTTVKEEKPALRHNLRANFRFQPNLNDNADIERFKTSIDEISCNRVTQQLSADTSTSSKAMTYTMNIISFGFILFLMYC